MDSNTQKAVKIEVFQPKTEAPEEVADEVVEVEVEQEEEGASQPEQAPESPTTEEQPDDAEEELVISIKGEESPPSDEEHERAPEWLRQLRRDNREKSRENKELRRELEELKKPREVAERQKPTLEGCGWDEDQYAAQLEAWVDHSRKVKEEADKRKAEAEAQRAAFDRKFSEYNERKTKLKVSDFEDAEAVVADAFNPAQQAMVVKNAAKPELLIYAIGRNPAKAKELGAIKDLDAFAFAVAKIEERMTVTKKKQLPAPERIIKGDSASSNVIDSTLDRLREQSLKTTGEININKNLELRRQQKKELLNK